MRSAAFDSIATQFLNAEFGLSRGDVFKALRCEGFSTLHDIYHPAESQSGYSTFTWGTNYQPVSKNGKAHPAEAHWQYQPCPDFGLVHCRSDQKCSLVGETKFSMQESDLTTLLRRVVRDLSYYVGLPSEPEKGWDYDFGFGVAYAAGGSGPRRSFLCDEYWIDHRFLVACFHG